MGRGKNLLSLRLRRPVKGRMWKGVRDCCLDSGEREEGSDKNLFGDASRMNRVTTQNKSVNAVMRIGRDIEKGYR